MEYRPILITGCHRSGSTWVSKMLALSPGVAFIDEVFNLDMGLLRNKKLFTCWFPFITDESEQKKFIQEIRKVINFKPLYHPLMYARLAAILYSHSRPISKNYLLLLTLLLRLFSYSRVLIKDPIALFASEWAAKRFNMDVVLLIRHPAAFVRSLIRVGWRFDFSNFLNQRELMERHLFKYEDRMKKKDMDILDEAALLWLCLYTVADTFIQRNPDWIVKRHEDLSFDTVNQFRELYATLGLRWTEKVQTEIIKYSSVKTESVKQENSVHFQIRDSKANIKAWKKKLTEDDVNRIRELVEPVSGKYYQDSDW